MGNRFCLLEVEEGVSDAEDIEEEEMKVEDVHHVPTKNKKVKRRKNVEIDRIDTDLDNDDSVTVLGKRRNQSENMGQSCMEGA